SEDDRGGLSRLRSVSRPGGSDARPGSEEPRRSGRRWTNDERATNNDWAPSGLVARQAHVMSRIADVLRKAREQNEALTGQVNPGAPAPRSIYDVEVPWSVGGERPAETEPARPEPLQRSEPAARPLVPPA